jgi:hypothetical protein
MAVDYKSLYFNLFNACTDALQDMEQLNFGQAKERLISAQQETEEKYLSQSDGQVES